MTKPEPTGRVILSRAASVRVIVEEDSQPIGETICAVLASLRDFRVLGEVSGKLEAVQFNHGG